MAEKKMTKREVITMLLAEDTIKANEVYVNYLTHEIELLDKKSAQPRKSKANAELEGYRATILEILGEAEAPLSLSEIKAKVDEWADFSPQKMSGIIKPFIYDEVKNPTGSVARTMDKRVAKFSLR